jgi:hypothetical protein
LIFVGLFVDLGFWGVDTASLLASIGVIALIIGLRLRIASSAMSWRASSSSSMTPLKSAISS